MAATSLQNSVKLYASPSSLRLATVVLYIVAGYTTGRASGFILSLSPGCNKLFVTLGLSLLLGWGTMATRFWSSVGFCSQPEQRNSGHTRF